MANEDVEDLDEKSWISDILEVDFKGYKLPMHIDRTGLSPGHELQLECGPPTPYPKEPTERYLARELGCSRELLGDVNSSVGNARISERIFKEKLQS